MKSLCCLLLALGLGAFPAFQGAAQTEALVQIGKSRLAELERRAADADRLEAELTAAKAEIARLKGEAQIAQSAHVTGSQPWIPPAVVEAAKKLPPTPEIASLPELHPKEIIPLHDLLNHFAANPVAAKARYEKKLIRIRGFVTDLDKPIFKSDYAASFRLPDHGLRVVAGFVPPAEFTRVYVTSDHERVVGETATRRVTFLQTGVEVVIEGYCTGLKDREVRLEGCKLLPDAH